MLRCVVYAILILKLCHGCEVGSGIGEGETICTECEEGKYKSEENTNACAVCPDNSASDPTRTTCKCTGNYYQANIIPPPLVSISRTADCRGDLFNAITDSSLTSGTFDDGSGEGPLEANDVNNICVYTIDVKGPYIIKLNILADIGSANSIGWANTIVISDYVKPEVWLQGTQGTEFQTRIGKITLQLRTVSDVDASTGFTVNWEIIPKGERIPLVSIKREGSCKGGGFQALSDVAASSGIFDDGSGEAALTYAQYCTYYILTQEDYIIQTNISVSIGTTYHTYVKVSDASYNIDETLQGSVHKYYETGIKPEIIFSLVARKDIDNAQDDDGFTIEWNIVPKDTVITSLQCILCPEYSVSNGQVCTCKEGATGPDGGPCNLCETGKYKIINGSSACILCPGHSTTVQTNECVCNTGYTGADAYTCMACVAGTYKNTAGTQACIQCDAGKYSTNRGMNNVSTCISCPDDEFTVNTGSTICMCTNTKYGEITDIYKARTSITRSGTDSASFQPLYHTDMMYGEISYTDNFSNYDDTYFFMYNFTVDNFSELPVILSLQTVTNIDPDVTGIYFRYSDTDEWENTVYHGSALASRSYRSQTGNVQILVRKADNYRGFESDNTQTFTFNWAILTNNDVCQHCPLNSRSNRGKVISDCICNVGWVRNPSHNASPHCVTCEAGKYYLNKTCVDCPEHSMSRNASLNISGCICNVGYEGNSDSSCSICSSGTYRLHEEKCMSCPAGKTSEAGSSVCVSCTSGTYLSNTLDSCVSCPEYSTSAVESRDISACVCNAGYTRGIDQFCIACAAGKYRGNEVNCTACAMNTFSTGGAVACSACELGSFSLLGSNNCTSCPSGTYRTTQDICTNCLINTYSESGAVACIACTEGTYSLNGSSNCTVCAAGKYRNTGNTCTDCSAGTYSDLGSSTCVNCTSNTYSLSASFECLECALYSTSSIGSPICYCNAGYTRINNSACGGCSAGKYKTTVGSHSCTDCAVGEYSIKVAANTPSVCTTCDTGIGSVTTPSGSFLCFCDIGYYLNRKSNTCMSCAAGMYKSEIGTSECVYCPADSFSTNNASALCENCPSGSESTLGSSVCTCQENYYGYFGDNETNTTISRTTEQTLTETVCNFGNFSNEITQNSTGIFHDGARGNFPEARWPGDAKNIYYQSKQYCYYIIQIQDFIPNTFEIVVNGIFQNKFVTIENQRTAQLRIDDYWGKNEHIYEGNFDFRSNTGIIRLQFTTPETDYVGYKGFEITWKIIRRPIACYPCPADSSCKHGCTLQEHCQCNTGTTWNDGGPCINCEGGKYKDTAGNIPCIDCAIGKYTGMSFHNCTDCPIHTTTIQKAGDSIEGCVCNIGYTTMPEPQIPTYNCRACAAGKYKNTPGSSQCINCSIETISVAGCGVCDAGWTLPGPTYGEHTKADCVCDAGFFGEGEILSWTSDRPRDFPAGPFYFAFNSLCFIERIGAPSINACEDYCANNTQCVAFSYWDNPKAVGGICTLGNANIFDSVWTPHDSGWTWTWYQNEICMLQISEASNFFKIQTPSNCTACEAGKYKDVSGSTPLCTECPANQYSMNSTEKRNTCEECPTNSISVPGSSARTDCQCERGFTGPNGGFCSPCDAATYKDVVGDSNCTKCATGKYSTTTASVSDTCMGCAAGLYLMSTGKKYSCERCPDNSISPGNSSARTDCLCNSGYTRANGGFCQHCPTGTYKGDTGDANCTKCAAGKYSAVIASFDCDTCGYMSTSPLASTSKIDCMCNAGYSGNGNTCTACVAGTYKTSPGPSACIFCSENTYSVSGAATNSSVCVPCPPNSSTTSLTGNDNIDRCYCDLGYKQSINHTTCDICKPGFYDNITKRYVCSKCPAGKHSNLPGGKDVGACDDCPAGKWSTPSTPVCNICPLHSNSPVKSGLITDCTCNTGASGEDGATCQLCPSGKYKNITGSDACHDCPAGTYSIDIGAISPVTCVACPLGRETHTVGSNSFASCLCSAGSWGKRCGECNIRRIKFETSSANAWFLNQWYLDTGSLVNNKPLYRGETTNWVYISWNRCDSRYQISGEGDIGKCLFWAREVSGAESIDIPWDTDWDDFAIAGTVTGKLMIEKEEYAPNTCERPCPCSACELGKYKALLDSTTQCALCPAGTFQNATGATRCEMCNFRKESVAGSRRCFCESGYFDDSLTSCEACSAGTFRANTLPISFYARTAVFGPQSWPVLENDMMVSSEIFACLPLQQDMTGKVALIKRGGCAFTVKVMNAQNAGAVAVIIYNNADPGVTIMAGSDAAVIIPAVQISLSSGETIVRLQAEVSGPWVLLVETDNVIIRPPENCTQCPARSASPPGSSALGNCTCNTGASGEDGATCQLCPSGKYKNITGSDACYDCPAGKYSGTSGAVSSETCSLHNAALTSSSTTPIITTSSTSSAPTTPALTSSSTTSIPTTTTPALTSSSTTSIPTTTTPALTSSSTTPTPTTTTHAQTTTTPALTSSSTTPTPTTTTPAQTTTTSIPTTTTHAQTTTTPALTSSSTTPTPTTTTPAQTTTTPIPTTTTHAQTTTTPEPTTSSTTPEPTTSSTTTEPIMSSTTPEPNTTISNIILSFTQKLSSENITTFIPGAYHSVDMSTVAVLNNTITFSIYIQSNSYYILHNDSNYIQEGLREMVNSLDGFDARITISRMQKKYRRRLLYSAPVDLAEYEKIWIQIEIIAKINTILSVLQDLLNSLLSINLLYAIMIGLGAVALIMCLCCWCILGQRRTVQEPFLYDTGVGPGSGFCPVCSEQRCGRIPSPPFVPYIYINQNLEYY